ncbi:MAG: DUF1961 family protein [Planctomycetota bacterium]
MPMQYENGELLHRDDFEDFENWHHEGAGEIERAPEGGMRLHCFGSRQGGPGCMAFFRPTLPDHVAFEYDVTVRSHGGLVINYVAIRGLNGEDLIEDRDILPDRTGVMRDYYSAEQGLQSYHISYSRFDDEGVHTETSNARRNPGCLLISQGIDPCTEINRGYHVRICKTKGHVQFFVDGHYSHGFFDRDTTEYPIPDTGKFGFRLIGSDVMADVESFRVCAIEPDESIWVPKG